MTNVPPDEKTAFVTVGKAHWEKNWASGVSLRSMSLLNIFNRDATTLLAKSLLGVDNPIVVEIGFVPGKFLHYLEYRFHAICHGYDYSESGCSNARQFLDAQGAKVTVHCQDVLATPPSASLQAKLVYSIGVVEHFDDPTGMIRAHLAPVADDGVVVIILPNYSDLNRWIQGALDPENLAIHNLDSMTDEFWERYSRQFPDYVFKTSRRGHLNPWMYSLQRFGKLGQTLQLVLNFLGFLLPPYVRYWAGMFVIEIRKR